LELSEAITLIGEGHVPDEVWARARTEFDDYELGQLVFAIATINTWNRILIAARVEPGHYQPGQFRAAPDTKSRR
jgi:alkylhydroperoxidase family enzyme